MDVRKVMKRFLEELLYIFCNYVVCYIPIWGVRRCIYQLMGMQIGKGARILMGTQIIHPWKISIGSYSCVNENCFLDGRGGISIGSNVTVAIYTKLITGYHNIDDDEFAYLQEKIIVENNAVIFADCTVLAGANIGKGCVIVAKSLVRRGNYIKNHVYAGNPAICVRERLSQSNYIQNKWLPILR